MLRDLIWMFRSSHVGNMALCPGFETPRVACRLWYLRSWTTSTMLAFRLNSRAVEFENVTRGCPPSGRARGDMDLVGCNAKGRHSGGAGAKSR